MRLQLTPCIAAATPARASVAALFAGIVAIATTLTAGPPNRGDLYILTVGVDGHYPDSATDINARDALHVRQAIVMGESFYRQVHSRALLGTAGTRTAVLDALAWMAGAVQAEDVAFVFFACHGTVEKQGHFISLARAPTSQAGEVEGIWGHELLAAMGKLKGQPILLVDSCYAGALLPAQPGRHTPAMIVSCAADAESSSQWQRHDRPSAFFVIAFCEALSGLADTDHDRIVTLKEVGDYIPARAQAFYEGQRAQVLLHPQAGSIPLAHVNSAWPPQQLLTPTPRRNPFRWPDVPNPDGPDVHIFARHVKLDGNAADPNAAAWPHAAIAVADGLDGTWASRWNKHKMPHKWNAGTATVKSVRDRVYIFFEGETGVKHLIDAVRVGEDRLVGRYFDPLRPYDSTPWVGRVIDHQRIDGEWGEGRWDFRRRFAPHQPDKAK
jgi:hypothetical protein